MIPYLFQLGPIKIGSYGLMMAIGFLFGWRMARRSAVWRGWDPELPYTIIISSMISGIIGARLFHVIDHWDSFRDDLLRAFTANSGLTWYGGLIAAILVNYYWCHRYRVRFIACLDMVAPMLASGYAFGRVGCLLAGDGCYGIPVAGTAWEWIGMAFPNGLVPTAVPVHPTPIYESLFNFALWGGLFALDRYRVVPRRWGHGVLFGIFCVLHSLERLLVEFIRLNDRYWFSDGELVKISSAEYFAGTWGLSFSQWISIAGILLGVGILVWAVRRQAPPYPSQIDGPDRYTQGWRPGTTPDDQARAERRAAARGKKRR